MHTIDTLFRRGTSTILGTLIFVGIMFTAVIPMLLVMRQAETIHTMRKYELEILDQNRFNEDLHVYVFNDTDSSESLTLRVENWSDFSVNIKRIWINDACYPLADFKVQPMNWFEGKLTGFTPFPDTHYIIKVATDRGNICHVNSGSLYCNIDGNWETELFTIYFTIKNQLAGWYDVNVTYSGTDDHVPGSPLEIHKSRYETAYDYCDVPAPGKYHVKITRKNDGELIYNNDDVTIYLTDGPRSATVRI